jgi:hypothetical protein
MPLRAKTVCAGGIGATRETGATCADAVALKRNAMKVKRTRPIGFAELKERYRACLW